MHPRVSVVVVTRDRRGSLDRTLRALRAIPEAPPVIVVDNDSRDGTPEHVAREHPGARLLRNRENLGAAARNVGVEAAVTPYVAFCDDDSWWGPGALDRGADHFDRQARLGLIAARVLVGPGREVDPTCREMARSPLPRRDGLPGPSVLGFLACGAMVRRSAFLEVGGFEARFGVGGEERLLAIDLAAAGWDRVYCDDLIAHHHPDVDGDRPGRKRRQCRNDLWSAWLRRPLGSALRVTARSVLDGWRDPEVLPAFRDALEELSWVVRNRRPISRELETQLQMLGL